MLQSSPDSGGRCRVQLCADEGAADSVSGVGCCVAVVDNEVQQLAEIIKPGPAVKLFPLVGAHEPE